jgi:acyl-CoA thioesterase
MNGNNILEKLETAFKEDPYAKSIGASLFEVKLGYSKVGMELNDSHLNFNGYVHGGIVFSLLDYAFSIASNSANKASVAVSMGLHFVNAAKPGSKIIAEAKEVSSSRKLGLYEMTVTDEEGTLIAKSDGRVYITKKEVVPKGISI